MQQAKTATQAASNSLRDFEQFMASQAHGWTLVNKTDKLLSYQKIVPPKKASCLILIILFILFVLPALVYLYFGHKSGKIHQLSVTTDDNGTLQATGDPEGLKLYSNYLYRTKKAESSDSDISKV